MFAAQVDCAPRQRVDRLPALRGELAQFVPRHPLLRVLKSGTELEEGGQLVGFLASEQVDQPGTASWSPQLADLCRKLPIALLASLCNKLLPSLDELIGREGVDLVGCSL
jgi:hypothetical protein